MTASIWHKPCSCSVLLLVHSQLTLCMASCLFSFFPLLQCKKNGAFSVVLDNYVREEEGTGVVHQAPYFGAVSLHL